LKKISTKSLWMLLNKAQAVVHKTSRKNVTSIFRFFLLSCLFDGCHGWKNDIQLKRTALKQKNKKHSHTGKEPEAHKVKKGLLSCDSDAPQVGSPRFDSICVLKVNRRKTNRRKTRTYCISFDHDRTVFRPWVCPQSEPGLWWKCQAVSWHMLQFVRDSEGTERQPDQGEGNFLCLDESRKILYSKRAILKKKKTETYAGPNKCLTLILLTWRIWWAPNNASRWQMGFNSAFKGLTEGVCFFLENIYFTLSNKN